MEGNVRIVVNDIAASEGGAISILKSLYQYILEADDINEWFFLLSGMYIKETKNVHVLLFKKEKKSRIRRLMFDNVYGGKIINDLNPDVVFYLQNTLVKGVKAKQVMYMDQPIPFQNVYNFSFFDKEQRPYAVYQYLIGKLIKSACRNSDKIIVQTKWIRDAIAEKCNIKKEKIVIIPPEIIRVPFFSDENEFDKKCFFYPASGAYYKNHICISKAMDILENEGINDICVGVTIDKNNKLNNKIKFYGKMDHKDVMRHLKKSTLLFPSYIETYGLPLVEARMLETIILAADTSFSHELLDGYDNAYFFDPFIPESLSRLMKKIRLGEISKKKITNEIPIHINSWKLVVDSLEK